MLTVREVVAQYQSREPVLQGVNLTIPETGIVALLGSNGAGKSTLMKCISGTIPLQGGRVVSGEISFRGTRIDGKGAATIAALGLRQSPEGRRIFSGLTVDENLDAGAFLVKKKSRVEQSRSEVFEIFPRLKERRKQLSGTLSGGEQQMLAIARALMSSPKLLLLDEPSLGLAPQIVEVITETIRNIADSGVPILLVEQNAAMALDLASTAYVLELGRIVLSGSADDLLESGEVQRLYLGDGAGGGTDNDGSTRWIPEIRRWSA